MEDGQPSHTHRCQLSCLTLAKPADVFKDERLVHTLKGFLGRCTREQLRLLCPPTPSGACSADTDCDDSGIGDSYEEVFLSSDAARAPRLEMKPGMQDLDGPRRTTSLETNSNGHDSGGDVQKFSAPSSSAHLSTTSPRPSDADGIVSRAYKAIINVTNLRWSMTGLQRQAPLLALSEENHLDSPGARLSALRSKLRNEQHMAIALDRIAAVLLVDMRNDLGESYDGLRERGFRTAIVGNKMLAGEWGKSHKEVVEEIRAAIAYSFAEDIISPGINLLLGSRSQDVWEKRFSRKKVEALHQLLKQTEEGRMVLIRASHLDDAVVTIKRILSIHIGYRWRCEKYASMNTAESREMLFEQLQSQLHAHDTDIRRLENTLYFTMDASTAGSAQNVFAKFTTKNSEDGHAPISTQKRRPSLSVDEQPQKRSNTVERLLNIESTYNAEHIIDGLPILASSITSQEPHEFRGTPSANGAGDALHVAPEDHTMLVDSDGGIQSISGHEEVQREAVSQREGVGDPMNYQYAEHWGSAEDVTTLDDILSLSW